MGTRPRIVITRPGRRAVPLVRAITALGAEAMPLEVMRQEVLPETQAMRSAWLDFDQFAKAVVISPFAAECLAEALDRYWPQLPVGPHYYAVGGATAEVLHERLGVRVHVPPTGQGDSSETLLSLPSLQALDEQKILLVAGEGGRPLLADTLETRGARLTRLALYRRILVAPDDASAGMLARGDFAALVVSSGEMLEHLAGWCTQATLNRTLIISSQRLATLAGSLGFRDLRVASGATPAALAAAVAEACDLDDADVDHDDLEKG
ncbi:uroporphyrinogen-III synthase [Litchfieldella rifensis]|uniref:Uroporphyrinogen-III synthase n=1 Tax=Litchfieldella rifensis TaxID=762643 RepID=A0ABV7LSY0_9GAMM